LVDPQGWSHNWQAGWSHATGKTSRQLVPCGWQVTPGDGQTLSVDLLPAVMDQPYAFAKNDTEPPRESQRPWP
jgi:hypothetical protein